MLEIGQSAPDFSFVATSNVSGKLSDYRGKPVILYFYPKDCTSGCTREGQDFRDQFAKFKAFKAVIFGISRDTLTLHEKFKTKENFPFELISDTDSKICDLFNVIVPKNMYGKVSLGISRSTFLIDGKGVLREEWRKVKVEGHVEEVLESLGKLGK